jgi:hypothetical protein
LFVEVHHIQPESEGGPDTLDNAAALCASCHDLFGGNPEKRKQIRQMRDDWWQKMEERAQRLSSDLERVMNFGSADHPIQARNLGSHPVMVCSSTQLGCLRIEPDQLHGPGYTPVLDASS